MADVTEEIRDYMARKYEEGYEQRHREAQERQREIAKHTQDQRSVDGLGAPVMVVDSRIHKEWIRKEGKEIWKDPEFRRRMARDHPEMVSKSSGTGKTMVGYGS